MVRIGLKRYMERKHPLLKDVVDSLFKKKYPIFLGYPINPVPRYGHGKPPHPLLYKLIDKKRSTYRANLVHFLKYKQSLTQISKTLSQSIEPAWINGFIPSLDAVSLYGLLCLNNPQRYFEIGSGNSTKFARKAIKDYQLRTTITSIDPWPRSEIDFICDDVIRQPLEDVDISIFEQLEAGDILFVDNSHRVFMNSDVAVVFLDILIKLRKGVLVEFHDIFLPYDYSPICGGRRYYSEQYLLACYLLAGGNKFDVVLPNMFISKDLELSDILLPLWEHPKMQGVKRQGSSFWIKIN